MSTADLLGNKMTANNMNLYGDVYSGGDPNMLDIDADGISNLKEYEFRMYGANPHRQDIFLEIDWMSGIKDDVSDSDPFHGFVEFKISSKTKLLLTLPFLKQYIGLHIDDGSMDAGGKIDYYDGQTSKDELIALSDEFFLNTQGTANPRYSIFRYMVVVDDLWDDKWYPDLSQKAGIALTGSDKYIMALAYLDGADYTILYAQKIMHELGHSIGLTPFETGFNGIDNFATANPRETDYYNYADYHSVMNYRYEWPSYTIVDYSNEAESQWDFNDWGNLNIPLVEMKT